ncbi:hypothetical protein GMA92_04180 [Turicibacter sanguinis]|uniref:Uncharacterized protein n=1 Tax=Turicibacter sanguinis TaxID=154288 RepID=A0A9X4XEZ2_9FIRM|nr:hypothetical protein [Turicibacter sanguinis]MTK72902.1 hypothetical protein [Turicibacter sanguinis]
MKSLNFISIFCQQVSFRQEANSLEDINGIADAFVVDENNVAELCTVTLVNGIVEESGKLIFILEAENGQELAMGDFELQKSEGDTPVRVDLKYVFQIDIPFPTNGRYRLNVHFIPTTTITDVNKIRLDTDSIVHHNGFTISGVN